MSYYKIGSTEENDLNNTNESTYITSENNEIAKDFIYGNDTKISI